MGMTSSKNDFYHRFLYQNLDLMIAVTQQVENQLRTFIDSKFRPKTCTTYIGADKPDQVSVSQINNLKEQYGIKAQFVVTIVGRMQHQKGQHIVIEAVSKLREQDKDVGLLIVGDAMFEAYLAELKALVAKLKLEKNVIFTDFVNNPSEFMQLSDAVVLATNNETFGLVLIEAMQAGIAVVASNNGGPLEIVTHQKTGLLFEAFDSDDLAKNLALLYEDKDFKTKIAAQGQQAALARFDANQQFEAVLDIYQQLLP